MAVKHGVKEKPPKEFDTPAAIKQRAAEARYNAFAYHYVNNGLNALQATISAGYSEHSAGSMSHDLLEITYVQKRIKELQEQKQAASKVTYDWIVQKILNTIESCERGETTPKGNKDAGGIVKCCDVLNKMHGYYAPDHHVVAPVDIVNEETTELVKDLIEKFRRPI